MMNLIYRLERMGYRFDVRLVFEYIRPDDNPPPEAGALLEDLKSRREEAILYIAERKFYPQHIRSSEEYRAAINKSTTLPEALNHALACVSELTGDSLIYEQNRKRWLS